MIAFWVDRAGRFGIDDFLARVGGTTAARVRPTLYDDLDTTVELRSSAHVFADLDRLTNAQTAAAEALRRHVVAHQPGVRVLNHPTITLQRYELLERLAEAGINRFRAFRADEDLDGARFPMFVRHRVRHTGAMTELLHTRRDLSAALRALAARGHRRRELLVVEFCDTSDGTRAFRKYAALKIGDRIVPRHVLIDSHWMVKGECNSPTLELAREELAYIMENPHEAQLLEVCRLAAVDYGRLDYAMLGDLPQVWEINLNPTLGGRSPQPERSDAAQRLVDQRRAASDALLCDAFAALDAGPAPPPVSFRLDVARSAGIRRELAARRRRRRTMAALHRLYDHPAAGLPFRWAYRRFLARH